ncbi:MAG TPA: 50S ribosomal protein L5 [Alphaproteobacteria bacterium]|nr:50S ribosomal protein L5 [Alphaproteobacteria bacterium]
MTTKHNPMRNVKVQKLTLNIGTGKDQVALEKAQKLLNTITGVVSVRTITQARIAAWGLRPGLPIGVKATMRKDLATKLIPKLLYAKDMKLSDNNFDDNGNVSFGIKEYIDIMDAKYDPDIGSMGLQCSITLDRPGTRIKNRKLLKRVVPVHHRVSKADAIKFMKEQFKVIMTSELEEEN